MVKPPKGSPHRYLYLAVNGMRVTGGLLLLLATCAGVGMGVLAGTGPGGPQTYPALIAIGVGILFYLLPGIGLLVAAQYLKGYRLWAAIVGLALCGMMLLLVLLGVAGTIIGSVAATGAGDDDALIGLFVSLGIMLIPLLILSLTTYYLSRSFTALSLGPPDDAIRGFEVRPVTQAEPGGGDA